MQVDFSPRAIDVFFDSWLASDQTKIKSLVTLINDLSVNNDQLEHCFEFIDLKHHSLANCDEVILALSQRCGLFLSQSKLTVLFRFKSMCGLTHEDWVESKKIELIEEGYAAAEKIFDLGFHVNDPIDQADLFEFAEVLAQNSNKKFEEFLFLSHIDQFINFEHPGWNHQLFHLLQHMVIQDPLLFETIPIEKMEWLQKRKPLCQFRAILGLLKGESMEIEPLKKLLSWMPTLDEALRNCLKIEASQFKLKSLQLLGAVLFQVYGTVCRKEFARELEIQDALSHLEGIDEPKERIKQINLMGEAFRNGISVETFLAELIP